MMISVETRRDTSTLPGARLRRVTDHIRANLEQSLTLARLSAVVCMSPCHFARLFQRTTGVPPHRFVLNARIDHAAGLLAKPGSPIAGIARGAGFRSPSHFSAVFRRITGVTPREYRARRLSASQPNGGGDEDAMR
jgi:AraC family transcriptional regulator